MTRRARTSAGWIPPPTTSPRGLQPGTLVVYETTLPVGTTRTRWKPRLEEGSGLVEGRDFHLVVLARASADRARVRRPAQVPQAGRRAVPGGCRSRHRVLRVGAAVRRAARPGAWQWRVGPRVGRGRGDGQTGRDDLPRRQHRPREPVRRLRGAGRDRRLPGHRGQQLPALQPHPPSGDCGRRALHPGLPAPVPVERPRRHRRAGGPGGQCGDAGVHRRSGRGRRRW